MTPVDLDAASAAILSWLLTYLIHSTILLGAAVAIAARFADEHTWLDRIWKTALLGPLVTASVQIGSDAFPLGGRWPIGVAAPVAVLRPMPPAPRIETPQEQPPTGSLPSSPAIVRGGQRVRPASQAATSASTPRTVVRVWPVVAVGFWLAIGAIGLVRFGARLLRLHRALGSGPLVGDAHLRQMVESVCQAARERSPIRLTTSHTCVIPLALTGRQIVLPEQFLELDAAEQRAALAHEIAHVTRRDPAWRILAGALERALFFQPLNRVARARLCESAEFLCDQWAVHYTRSPLALARCLSTVAAWTSMASDGLAAGASTMARSDSPLIRRVTRILSDPPPAARRPPVVWLVLPLAVVTMAAPLVTAARLPDAADATAISATLAEAAIPPDAGDQKQEPSSSRVWTASEVAQARARLRIHRSPRPVDTLAERWRWALTDAGRQGIGDFWVVYTFDTPTHAQDLMMSDTRGDSFVSATGNLTSQGPPLGDLLDGTAPAGGVGNVTVLIHYDAAKTGAIDRGGYRSTRLSFDFGRTPVYWLGLAPETESFARVQELFAQARTEKIQVLLIELASLHPTTDLVLPFLTRLVDPSNPVAIRREAAEGFDHHHDPRSVEILLRVARTDTVSDVRAEAAETIGEVQTPQAIPALTDLATNSPDPAVRRQAAEAFGDQPPHLALPAIERLIATSVHEDVQAEAVETLGDLEVPGATTALVSIVWEHKDVTIQREAVETLGDRHDRAAVTELERIVQEHPVEDVQAEAIETLADVSNHRVNPVIFEVALSGKSPRLRREALDAIAHVASDTSDAAMLDKAQHTIERAIFDDPDRSVRMEALDALDGLPRDRALSVLRSVLERHPDAELREDAKEHQRGRRDKER
jgi:HEAT repeat protein/beta-lactamase regulating signal transducer with metallopeptidase domain